MGLNLNALGVGAGAAADEMARQQVLQQTQQQIDLAANADKRAATVAGHQDTWFDQQQTARAGTMAAIKSKYDALGALEKGQLPAGVTPSVGLSRAALPSGADPRLLTSFGPSTTNSPSTLTALQSAYNSGLGWAGQGGHENLNLSLTPTDDGGATAQTFHKTVTGADGQPLAVSAPHRLSAADLAAARKHILDTYIKDASIADPSNAAAFNKMQYEHDLEMAKLASAERIGAMAPYATVTAAQLGAQASVSGHRIDADSAGNVAGIKAATDAAAQASKDREAAADRSEAVMKGVQDLATSATLNPDGTPNPLEAAKAMEYLHRYGGALNVFTDENGKPRSAADQRVQIQKHLTMRRAAVNGAEAESGSYRDGPAVVTHAATSPDLSTFRTGGMGLAKGAASRLNPFNSGEYLTIGGNQRLIEDFARDQKTGEIDPELKATLHRAWVEQRDLQDREAQNEGAAHAKAQRVAPRLATGAIRVVPTAPTSYEQPQAQLSAMGLRKFTTPVPPLVDVAGNYHAR